MPGSPWEGRTKAPALAARAGAAPRSGVGPSRDGTPVPVGPAPGSSVVVFVEAPGALGAPQPSVGIARVALASSSLAGQRVVTTLRRV